MSKNLRPHNNKGQRHGVWQKYWNIDGGLIYRCLFHNSKRVGYSEYFKYSTANEHTKKTYHL